MFIKNRASITIMACEKIYDWDWKSGKEINLKTKNVELNFNYFTCGIYFFDGIYQCVKFPKGMRVYHGSTKLAYSNNEYPAGMDFYTKDANINSLSNTLQTNNVSVEEAISNQLPVKPAWFSTANVAQIYSAKLGKVDDSRNQDAQLYCKDKCISAYRLKNDATFILLDNDFNIWRFLTNESIPETIKTRIKIMFSLDKVKSIRITNDNKTIKILDKFRSSYYDIDFFFAEWLCKNQRGDYAGYASDATKTMYERMFHLEFMICNSVKMLERDLESPLDWQYFSTSSIPPETKQLLEQMKLYKSINVGFHAGNLFEHSIWSALFAEQVIFNSFHIVKMFYDETEKRELFCKKIVAIALLHDIGKMAPQSTRMQKQKSKFIYFSIPEHPKLGGDYIRGTKQMPVLNSKTLEIERSFNIPKLFNELELDYSTELETTAKMIDLHWDLGNLMYKGLSGVDEYLSLVIEDKRFLYGLLVVSIADILASQPYGVNNLTAELNHHSKYFPYISNVPRKYKGGNVVDTSAETRKTFVNLISNKIFKTNFSTP